MRTDQMIYYNIDLSAAAFSANYFMSVYNINSRYRYSLWIVGPPTLVAALSKK